ncbi:putative dihydroxy-acid dehydratase [Hortaea werneckii]|nr:putative dihydroxy-acid dehydratase [Hortaea werneckii]
MVSSGSIGSILCGTGLGVRERNGTPRAFSQSASRCRATPLDPSDEGLNKVSSTITQPIAQGASQAQLYATGLNEADLKKAQVGISSVWFSGNPCNMHLLDLNHAIKKSVQNAGLVGMQFNTIGVSDGMSMGTKGMRYSLQSRDIIADSIETMMCGQWYDANISIPGCDKNMPGVVMAMGRVNRPSIMVVRSIPLWRHQRRRAFRHHPTRVSRQWRMWRYVHRQHSCIGN